METCAAVVNLVGPAVPYLYAFMCGVAFMFAIDILTAALERRYGRHESNCLPREHPCTCDQARGGGAVV